MSNINILDINKPYGLLITRCLALVFTIGLSYLPTNTFLLTTFAIIFSHYVLSLIFARRSFQKTFSKWQLLIPALFLVLLAFVQNHYLFPSIFIYFGIHHALTETYIPTSLKELQGANSNTSKLWMASRFCFHLFAFYFIGRNLLPGIWLMHSSFWITVVTFLLSLLLITKQEQRKSFLITDGIVLIPFIYFFFVFPEKILLAHMLLFHNLVWYLYPLSLGINRRTTASPLMSYAFLAVTTSVFFFVLLLFSVERNDITYAFWYACLLNFAYIHLNVSYFSSTSNPMWIRKLFKN